MIFGVGTEGELRTSKLNCDDCALVASSPTTMRFAAVVEIVELTVSLFADSLMSVSDFVDGLIESVLSVGFLRSNGNVGDGTFAVVCGKIER